MTDEQMARIRACFDELTPRTPELADRFMARFFAQNPSLRPLFPRDLSSEKQDFSASLRQVIKNLHRIDSVQNLLMDAGARQSRIGLTPGHLGAAREALLITLRDMVGAKWTDQLQQDWTEALNTVVAVMVVGAGRARVHAA